MTPNDSLQRFVFENAAVRGEFIHLEQSVQEILTQHNYPPAIKKLLAEFLCVAGLLTAIIKFDGRLTVQFRGEGNLKLIIAQCDHHFQLRGLVKFKQDSNYDELLLEMKKGLLAIMVDSSSTKRYQGIVNWEGFSIAESIENYFKQSEQLTTKLYLNVSDQSAAGLLLQAMPTASAPEMENLEWYRLMSFMDGFDPKSLLTANREDMLKDLFPSDEIRIFPPQPIKFQCTCSRQRSEQAILILGREEAEAELQDNQVISVTCDFCNAEYTFDRDAIEILFNSDQNSR